MKHRVSAGHLSPLSVVLCHPIAVVPNYIACSYFLLTCMLTVQLNRNWHSALHMFTAERWHVSVCSTDEKDKNAITFIDLTY